MTTVSRVPIEVLAQGPTSKIDRSTLNRAYEIINRVERLYPEHIWNESRSYRGKWQRRMNWALSVINQHKEEVAYGTDI